MNIEKITKCPGCNSDIPAFYTRRIRVECNLPELGEVRDTCTYELVCLKCEMVMSTITIKNTVGAYKKFCDELNKIYGKPEYLALIYVRRERY